MIITFDLQNLKTKEDDTCIILDNCRELRIKDIDSSQKMNIVDKNFDALALMSEWVVKKWLDNSDESVDDEVYFYSKCKLLHFKSNGLNYYIVTKGKVYIANDDNKTFKVIN